MSDELKEAFKTLEALTQEVTLDKEETMAKIVFVLEEENKNLKSEKIDKVIEVLKLWGKVPASELKQKAEVI